ncbi:hypothetical protein E2R23_00965 [Burkholderia pseudomallei]|nr:hypothetical protein EXY72_00960 [Burkholderia pseudomallei]QBP56228.1 hypothetical protein E2R23_00965 [Burkholderia pseudomallei]
MVSAPTGDRDENRDVCAPREARIARRLVENVQTARQARRASFAGPPGGMHGGVTLRMTPRARRRAPAARRSARAALRSARGASRSAPSAAHRTRRQRCGGGTQAPQCTARRLRGRSMA